MQRDYQKEKEFYSKPFKFSYSSLNKLLFSPSLFYKDYILKDREEKLDKHLVEGKLIHCLLFEPENLEEKFSVMPGKTPTDNVKKLLYYLKDKVRGSLLDEDSNDHILDALKIANLYQSFKEDEKRLAKIQTEDNEAYWQFIKNTKADVVDEDTLQRCKDRVELIKSNKDVMSLFTKEETDFELDSVTTHAEAFLECNLDNRPFGLKGFVDYYSVDEETKQVTICDLKTTGKTIADFAETVDFYNYWLQAAMYCKLVYENLPEERDDYKISFKFVVIDKYDQVYVFDVADQTLDVWMENLISTINIASYHFSNKNYSLPYQFLQGKVIL